MAADHVSPDLIAHLARTLGISDARAAHALAEVLAYYDETSEQFVQRRHRELQRDGVANKSAFKQIAAELDSTRFRAAPLSERQIRRLIYG